MSRDQGSWRDYYTKGKDLPPRETLLKALEFFRSEGRSSGTAIDLGAGGGRDTLHLLEQGWQVTAVDAEPDAVEALRDRAKMPDQLEVQLAKFNRVRWTSVDLVNASYALPFCDPVAFPLVWFNIERHLRSGGRFSGHFLGPEDDWCSAPDIHCFSTEEVNEWLEGWEVEYFHEERKRSASMLGPEKEWHVFHVVARRG